MKECSKCGIKKEDSEFWIRRDRDGRHGVCAVCKEIQRKEYRKKDPQKFRDQCKRSYEKHRESRIARQLAYEKSLSAERRAFIQERKRMYFKNSYEQKKKKAHYRKYVYDQEKLRANMALSEAIQSGKLVKPNQCQICNQKKELDGHHSDYSKPLQVLWVCRKCHIGIHQTLKRKG